jgi:hypothetical protein
MATSNRKLISSYVQSNIQNRFVIAIIMGLLVLGIGLYQLYSAYSFNANLASNQQPKSYTPAIVLLVIGGLIFGYAFINRSITRQFVKNVI